MYFEASLPAFSILEEYFKIRLVLLQFQNLILLVFFVCTVVIFVKELKTLHQTNNCIKAESQLHYAGLT